MTEKTVRIRPGVGLLSLFPAMNYKAWFALGEMVDNSIQSYVVHRQELRQLHGPKFKLHIDISFEGGKDPRIIVEDNAAGIFEKDIDRAFTPAARPPDRTGISQFGIGMKSSATWYSNYYTISSSALGEKVTRTVVFDIDKIISEEIEDLPIEVEAKKNIDEHGTRIVMRDLHQGIPVGATLGKIRSYLASIYREFVKSGEVVITVGGEELSYIQPLLLESPFWDTDKGPKTDGESRVWSIPIDFVLSESWETDAAPNRPASPPRIRGWIGILKEGSTKLSGTALVWKQKVVVGAGSMAQGDEDSYRPGSVFGASTTFPFQRLFGELDVSELQVTTFKDQIDWRDGQELELQNKLRKAIEDGDEPMLRMARNYRSTLKTKNINKTVETSVAETVSAAASLLEDALSNSASELASLVDRELHDELSEKDVVRKTIPLPGDPNTNLVFEVTIDPGLNRWLSLKSEHGSSWKLSVNRAHPFMNSFANLPGADLDPILRLSMAIGLAEISAISSGIEFPQYVRMKVNEMLNGDLSSRMETKDEK
jgi:hypothetical protein